LELENGRAISLALEVRADLLLLDDLAGRHEAKARNIAVAGTLAVLLEADLRGYIDFPAAMKQLRQFGFRTSESIEASVMALYKQAKNSKP
jgi:predicted nucleic acid-binding protein